jgi:hypothetical protein
MKGQAVRLGCGLTLAGLSGFVVWFCCLLANLKMSSAGLATYLKRAVDQASADPGLAVALLLGAAGFVAGCVLAGGAFFPRRAKP